MLVCKNVIEFTHVVIKPSSHNPSVINTFKLSSDAKRERRGIVLALSHISNNLLPFFFKTQMFSFSKFRLNNGLPQNVKNRIFSPQENKLLHF